MRSAPGSHLEHRPDITVPTATLRAPTATLRSLVFGPPNDHGTDMAATAGIIAGKTTLWGAELLYVQL